jgi:cold shock CspA family protein
MRSGRWRFHWLLRRSPKLRSFVTDGGPDVFVHISAVERAGMSNLNEGQTLTYDVVSERGKLAASNLQNV